MINNTNASQAQIQWESINWNLIEQRVKQLQVRIAKAIKVGKYRKANALQWILTHSYYAKLLAIRRVTTNRGSKTAGSDNIIWRTPRQKLGAVLQLKRRGYKTLPLRRVYIPKSNGKLRPLSIPTMRDRAMQALYLLALDPIVESVADHNSYGFRPHRSTADAIEQCFRSLCMKTSATWVLEGDIKACFDNINHEWLRTHVPMDKIILSKWLNAGFIDKQQLYTTLSGVPQGGVISPTLLTFTLHGLEAAIHAATAKTDKVNLVTYADDFIVTASSKDVLEQTVKPIIIKFLSERGLELSQEKTLITHINLGFDFLGFNIRKYKDKLLIKPARKNVTIFLRNIRNLVRAKSTIKAESLISLLNPKIRGWANYYRHAVSKAIFSKVDHNIFQAIWKWARRRHQNKSLTWVYRKYFYTKDAPRWTFNAGMVAYQGRYKLLTLGKAGSVPIKRHIKIQAKANPYYPEYKVYFEKRLLSKNIRTDGRW